MTVPLGYQLQSRVGALVRRIPATGRPLAAPPPGSDLRPVLGEPGPPLIGHSLSMLHDTLAIEQQLYDRYGPVHWVGTFGSRFVMALGPEAVDEILSNRGKSFSTKGWDTMLGPFFHRGVLLLDGEEHVRHRRILQLAFGRQQLAGYLDIINAAAAVSLSKWRPGNDFRVYPAAKELLLELAIRVFVGAEPGPEAERVSRAFVDTVAAAKAFVRADLPGSQWRRGLHGRRILVGYFREQLPRKRTGAGKDLFTVLAQLRDDDGLLFDDDAVINHMIFVLLAAHDTSSIVLSQLVRLLGQHPDWRARLREESRALGRATMEYDDQDKLPALDLVFRETLRLYPPVGAAVRQAVCDTSIQGHHIPEGTLVAAFLYPTHRMEPWWRDGARFDPERFTDERREDRAHRLSWAPFGTGVHKCIGMYFGGMEIKAITHQLLLAFDWTVHPDYDPPISFGTGPFPADGLPIRLTRRDETE